MKEERKEVEIFPLCRAKVCQDEEIDSRFALSWLLITKIIPLPFPFFFSSSFSQYILSFSRSNALKLETILFEIVLPPRYLYGGRGIGRHEGPESWVFRLDDCCRCWEKNCCAIMAQFLAGIRNYSTELKETVRRGRRREKERSARINEKLDAKWRGISIVSSMILCARGRRERVESPRGLFSSQLRGKRGGEIRCASIMPVSRELSRDY